MLRFIIFSTILCCTQWSVAQSSKAEYYQYLENYAPQSLGMMELLQKTPSKFKINDASIELYGNFKPEIYFNPRTEEDKIRSLNNVIHESHHHFHSAYAYQMLSENTPEDYKMGDQYAAFYYADDDILLVKQGDVFNSNQLKKEIPKDLRSFRYKPYIAPKTNMGSQLSGIYGLMDEFHSYYLGTRTSIETFDYYLKKSESDMNAFLDFVSNASSSYWAFYEFKYFCLKYLEKAEKDYPQIYNELMNNKTLRKIYTKTTIAYEQQVEKYHELENQVLKLAESKGLHTENKDGYFWIGGRGVGNRGEHTELLKTELSKPEMLRLHKAFLLSN